MSLSEVTALSSQLCDMSCFQSYKSIEKSVQYGRSVVSQLDETVQSGESNLRLQIILFLLVLPSKVPI